MSNELARIEESDIVDFLNLYGFSDIPDFEKRQFIKVCQMNSLNPFKREAHISAYGEGTYRKFAIITGYEVYIKRAEASGRLSGWSTKIEPCKTAKTDSKGHISFIDDIAATITIHRKDFNMPFEHTVKFSEYVGTKKGGEVTSFWQKPESQLKKVAISQGFRLCFNEILGGLPFQENETESYKAMIIKEAPRDVELKSLVETNKTILTKDLTTQQGLNVWDAIVQKLASGVTIDVIEKHYSITDEQSEELLESAIELRIEQERETLND